MNIIIGHSNTDLDCLASMIAAQKLYPGYDIIISGLLNPLAGNVVSFYITKLSFKGPADLKDQQIDNVVVVDTRSSMRVKEFFANISRVNGSITIFDHHPTDGCDIPGAELNYVKNGANTSTMVLKLMEKGIKLDSDEATIALTGIYADTQSFTTDSVTPEDFQAASYLISQGASMKLARFFLQPLKNDYQISYFHTLLNVIDRHVIKGHEVLVSYLDLPKRVNGLAAVVEQVFSVEKADAIFAMFHCQADDSTSIIARSRKKAVPVNQILSVWGGGGHEKAASATIKKTGDMNVPLMLKEELQKLPPDRTAESIMTTPVKTIPMNVSIARAKEYLEEINHTAAPVVDDEGKMVGMMGNKNIRNAEKAGCMETMVPAYMNKKVVSINKDSTMRDIEKVFLENKYNHMPVIDDSSMLVGILTRKDFLKAIHEEDELTELLQTR
ncbi:MAG: CBS domain-containing protein [Spirochaetales bacterium]|nr:CBS domain-containing protein [Spirochaetales bacterium]